MHAPMRGIKRGPKQWKRKSLAIDHLRELCISWWQKIEFWNKIQAALEKQ